MKQQNRKIILFPDNAPCHPFDMRLSHVKLQYFHPNTTSKLQSLDQGIIRTFKTYYRKHVVKYLISRCATAQSLDDIKITPLDAIHWIDSAWQSISAATICNTFRSAGFGHETLNSIGSTTLDSPAASPSANPTTNNDECNDQL